MKRTIAGLLAVLMLTAGGTVLPASAPQSAAMTAFAAEQSASANPIISRKVPAYSGGGTASNGNDDAYWTAWQSNAPDYLAYDLSGVPASQRKQVIAVWYNDSTYDNIGGYVNKGEEPIDYVIEVNKAAGGSFPSDGWETAVTVSGNTLSSRQHLVRTEGYNWIRIRVTKAEGNKIKFNFDIHDASNGVQDSWVFFGDSITAGGMGNSWGTSFAAYINRLDSRYYPVAQNGGIGGILSSHGKAAIDGWLEGSPVKYVSIAYGTNDGWNNNGNLDSYYQNTKYMIDAVLKRGKVPVLPTIPYASDPSAGKYTADYNKKVTQLYSEYGSKLLHGPDFYAMFKANPSLLSADGVHPSSDGYEAMRKLWAETMYETVYKNLPTEITPSVLTGDLNGDSSVNLADAVRLMQHLLRETELTEEQAAAADLDGNKRINAADLTLLKRLLLTAEQPPVIDDPPVTESFSQVYEAEKAQVNGANSIQNDSGASGGAAVGNFADNADTVAFTVDVPVSGIYKLTVTAKGIGGNKTNNVSADGQSVGSFESGTSYTDAALKGVMLTAGKHTITVSKSWGWILLDKIKVETDEGISKSVYNVSNKLINPNADAATQKVFNYLCESYGKYTLAGQVCDYGMDGPEYKSIYEVTGKYPAICGLDFMDYAPCRAARGARGFSVDTAMKIHQAGGLVTFCWHWNAPDKYLKSGNDASGNPRWWQGFSTSNTDFDIAAVMNGKDPEGKALIDADIAAIAKLINQMGAAGIPILWRPLHEASGGWFWWGAKGAEPYKQFWKYLYDQFTNVYHCNNLIWVWNGQAANWYPGDEYVDVIGEDIYADAHSYGAQNAKFAELLEYPGTNKITALTENGVVFDIDNVVASNARWMWFGTWCGGFVTQNGRYSSAYTEADIMRKTYQSEHVITLDELPDFS